MRHRDRMQPLVGVAWLAGLLVTGLTPAWAQCVAPPTGVVSWWPGDGHPADIAGSSHGTLVGSVGYAAGEVGQAFDFSGGRVDVPGVGDPGASPFSVEFWMNANDPGSNTYLLGKSHADGGLGWDVRLDASTIRVVGVNGWGFNITSDASATPAAWHHVALSSTAATVELWIDGTLKGTSPRSPISTTANPFRMGYATNYGGGAYAGRLDEVTYYDRALPAGEIAAVYAAGVGGKCRPACLPPLPGLVSWWSGDGSARDLSGTNHGTLTNGAGFTAGKAGSAFAFDGADDFVTVPDAPALRFDPTAPMSLEAWVYRTSPASLQHIIGKRMARGGEPYNYQLVFWDANGICLSSSNGSVCTSGGTADLPLNAWTHLAATSGGGTFNVYVNGVLRATGPGTLGPADGAPFTLGTSGTVHETGQSFGGRLDEVAIYDRALSPAEIEALYGASSAGKCRACTPPSAGLISWWKAEDDALDSWGGNDGALAAGAGYAAGTVGRAFRFTGAVDSYVDVPDDPSLEVTGAFSVGGWFYIDPAAAGNAYELATLISKSDGSAESGFFLALDDRNGTRNLWLVVGAIAWVEATRSDAIAEAGWHHVAGVFDPSAMPQARLYLDGVAVADSGAGAIPAMNPNAWSLRIGAMHWTEHYGVGNDRFNGLADEVELVGRALSAAEVAAIHDAGSAGHCATCAYSIDPTASSVGAAGGTGTVSVTTGPACPWTAVSNDLPWLSVVSGDSGTGQGSVGYSVAATTGAGRAGTLTVAGQTFSLDQAAVLRTLTVSRTGSGSGRITATDIDCGGDCTGSYAHGTTVDLTATPDTGSAFAGWSGDCSGFLNPLPLAMDADKSCAARFDPATVSIGTRSKSVGTPPFRPGGPVTYTITLSNTGNSAQPDNPGHELVDVLPSELTSISAGATSGTASVEGSTVSWDGSISSGGSVTITIDATIAAATPVGTRVSNQAAVHYDADANGTNESTAVTDDPAAAGADDPTAFEVAPLSLDFYTLTPCRAFDTRDAAGTYGGPALAAKSSRVFPMAGRCGIPATARALSVNFTVTQPTATGNMRLYPAGIPLPNVSSINYTAGQTRANNAVVALDEAGELTVYCFQSSGTAHAILDVNGYFE
jgi:uncharacterized repeat protein (TIGR01451 family)